MSTLKPEEMGQIHKLVQEKKVILVLGPGGVGKTTVSATLAVKAASEGKKVGLLSIDPAKRLAAAMGIKLGEDLKKVEIPHSNGELWACMLDQSVVFDSMVKKFSNKETANKIFRNAIYKQVSKNLGGPLEYMALAKLNQMITSERFDLIVLDTPPDTHAMEFLVKPNILSGFVEKGVMTWLIKPFYLAQKVGLGRVFGFGEKLMGGVAAVTGVNMLEKLSEFLVLMDSVIKGFHNSGKNVAERLRRGDTGFIVVLSPLPSSLRSAKNIQKQLISEHFTIDSFIVNRVLPEWQIDELQKYHSSQTERHWFLDRL